MNWLLLPPDALHARPMPPGPGAISDWLRAARAAWHLLAAGQRTRSPVSVPRR